MEFSTLQPIKLSCSQWELFFAGTLIYSLNPKLAAMPQMHRRSAQRFVKSTAIDLGFTSSFNITCSSLVWRWTPHHETFPHFLCYNLELKRTSLGFLPLSLKQHSYRFVGVNSFFFFTVNTIVKQIFLGCKSLHPLDQYFAAGLQGHVAINFAHLDPGICSCSSWQNCSSSVKLDGSFWSAKSSPL